MKPLFGGLVCLLSGGATLTEEHPCLDLDIDAFRLRLSWADLQPNEHPTDDSFLPLDDSIRVAAEHGKKVGFNVAGGIKRPAWAYDKAYKYHYTETDPHIKPPQSVGDIALPWDAEAQRIDKNFVKQLGQRYDGNPAVAYIMATHFMQICPMYLAGEEDVVAMTALAMNPPPVHSGLLAYNSLFDAYVPSAKWYVDLWMRAFPTTPVLVTISPPWPGEDGQDAQNMVKNYGLEAYPGRFGTFVAARYAEADVFPARPVDYPKGCQFAYNATKQNHKQWKKPAPDPIPENPETFVATIDAACAKGDKFAECYEVDLLETPEEVLTDCRAKLLAMV